MFGVTIVVMIATRYLYGGIKLHQTGGFNSPLIIHRHSSPESKEGAMHQIVETKVIHTDYELREFISLLKFLWEEASERNQTLEVSVKRELTEVIFSFGEKE